MDPNNFQLTRLLKGNARKWHEQGSGMLLNPSALCLCMRLLGRKSSAAIGLDSTVVKDYVRASYEVNGQEAEAIDRSIGECEGCDSDSEPGAWQLCCECGLTLCKPCLEQQQTATNEYGDRACRCGGIFL